MTTGTLALIIAIVILLQLFGAVFYSLRKRKETLDTNKESRSAEIGAPETAHGTEAWEGFRAFRVVRRIAENKAGNVVSFYLEPESPSPLPPFKPGQFLTFQFDLQRDGEKPSSKTIRCYSLSDRPREDGYRISVKKEKDGLISSHLHEKVQEGDRLMVKAPSGRFHLSDHPSLPVVLIAGGIGITPMLSILLTMLSQESQREIWLFYGVRNGDEAIMHPQLDELASRHSRFHLHFCYSRPLPSERPGIDYQYEGRVDIELLQQTLKFARYQFYVCGPASMMESVVPGLEALGVSAEDIHYEAFGPATAHKPRPMQDKTAVTTPDSRCVEFRKSGKTTSWKGEFDSLLSFAESQGIAVESGCRAGMCGGCKTRIESGEVSYTQQPADEVEDGHCLLCISQPKSDLALLL